MIRSCGSGGNFVHVYVKLATGYVTRARLLRRRRHHAQFSKSYIQFTADWGPAHRNGFHYAILGFMLILILLFGRIGYMDENRFWS